MFRLWRQRLIIRNKHDAELAAGKAGNLDPDQKKVVVPHGFRSTFRDWVGEETNWPSDIAEAALAHVIGDKTQAAYERGTKLEKRRELMSAWPNYCERADGGNVVRLAR